MVDVLLKPGLENFEHYFTSMLDKSNCVVVRAFFGMCDIINIQNCVTSSFFLKKISSFLHTHTKKIDILQ